MKCDELAVVRLFSDDLSRELTIRQKSSLIEKSYFYTNTLVHSMVKENLLLKKVYGHSIVCSLNQDSGVVKALINLDKAISREKLRIR
jgi:hypothetical protein